MVDLAIKYPDAETIYLVIDDLNIHRRKALTDLLGEEFGSEVWNRFTVHYAPRYGSWLNQAEIEIGLLSRKGFLCATPNPTVASRGVRLVGGLVHKPDDNTDDSPLDEVGYRGHHGYPQTDVEVHIVACR
jgi:hypothetical protein